MQQVKKNAELVTEAFKSIKRPLDQINILHTDRGNEFKNKAIDDILDRFDIERSLSNKGCPYCYEPRNISVTRTWFSPVNE